MSRVFSGIQPSGRLGLSHYLGAIKRWENMQQTYECLFCIVDQHAITVAQKPEDLRRQTLECFALYLACGLDPERSILFIQSQVPGHSQLSWILNCLTGMGELNRMTQFKDKSGQQEANINAGLFAYPVLMAADVLLYDTNLVPVGADQKQHLELTRDLAMRFNHHFGETLVVPEPVIAEHGARIMSLQDPLKKMSKSDPNTMSFLALLDSPELISKKIKRAVTDSQAHVAYDPDRAGISNLVVLYHCLSGQSYARIEKNYQGQGYGHFKHDLAELIVETITPIQTHFKQLWSDQAMLLEYVKAGAERANQAAQPVLDRVYDVIGFIR